MGQRVTNTATQKRSMLDAIPGMIEASEARGNAELAASDQLPREGILDSPTQRAALEAMGIKILGPTDGDDLFVDVVLPAGWQKAYTGHSMWLHLVDTDGWVRAAIFYKAAFYDRNARISLRRRYTYQTRYLDDYTRVDGYVLDNRVEPTKENEYRVIWQPEPLRYTKDREAFEDNGQEKQGGACKAWLDANLPQWTDPLAYWNDPQLPTVGTFPPWSR